MPAYIGFISLKSLIRISDNSFSSVNILYLLHSDSLKHKLLYFLDFQAQFP